MFNMFKKQGTSKRSASTSIIGDREPGDMATPTTGEQAMAGDMAWAGACEELSDAQLATCGGGDMGDINFGLSSDGGRGELSSVGLSTLSYEYNVNLVTTTADVEINLNALDFLGQN